jgi:hypothetical protein
MKRTIFYLLFFPLFSNAQIDKGRKMVGGFMGFNSNKLQNSINLQPQFGYFITKKIALGTGIGLNVSKPKLNNNSSTISVLSINPFIRNYINNKKVSPFIQSSFSYNKVISKSVSSSKLSMWNLGIGNSFFINNFVSVDLIVNYSYNTQNKLNNGINSNIGFQILL